MCDTFVVLPSSTSDGTVIFGKNSDREPNEAQALELHGARRFPPGTKVKCTYIEIPQVRETLAVLLCRPFWMWGAEMGANEKGVVIGNEAVFTKMPVSRRGGLTGMDLLRLALERSGTAEQAVETIVRLLADHGQGGICGYRDKRMAYHNSFLIADPAEAWVLETAGPLWAARRVRDCWAISNGLTLGEAFDLSHPELIETARRKGWLKKRESFHFARCFSDWFYTTFSASRARRRRALSLLRRGRPGGVDVAAALALLRDHREEPYRPDGHFLGDRICAHAGNRLARNATQTTGSLVAHLADGRHTFWATGTAAPCTGVFKPIWFDGGIPDLGATPGKDFDPRSLWWHHERLHRSVLLDCPNRAAVLRGERDALEGSFLREADSLSPLERGALTREAFERARKATERWTERVAAMPVGRRSRWTYRRYWKALNAMVGFSPARRTVSSGA